jgi:alpha-amylase
MQWAYYTSIRRLEPLIKEVEDNEFLRIWRNLQTSDHLYYMFTASGGPGEVHSYFSPFRSPVDAYVTAQSAVLDFENRVKLTSVAANEPFLFYRGKGEKRYTGVMVWSLKGFAEALQRISSRSIKFHSGKGDFERWAETSLRDSMLAERLREVRLSGAEGAKLRQSLVRAVEERFRELADQTQRATKYL